MKMTINNQSSGVCGVYRVSVEFIFDHDSEEERVENQKKIIDLLNFLDSLEGK